MCRRTCAENGVDSLVRHTGANAKEGTITWDENAFKAQSEKSYFGGGSPSVDEMTVVLNIPLGLSPEFLNVLRRLGCSTEVGMVIDEADVVELVVDWPVEVSL